MRNPNEEEDSKKNEYDSNPVIDEHRRRERHDLRGRRGLRNSYHVDRIMLPYSLEVFQIKMHIFCGKRKSMSYLNITITVKRER